MRASLIFAILAATVTAMSGTALAQTPPAPPGAQIAGSYYLALGDSLGYGVTTAQIAPDPLCQSPTAPGYVCQVYGYLKFVSPGIQLFNLSGPDVDSCVMLHGTGPACPSSPTQGNVPSPLNRAVQIIKDHPNQPGPITVNVGGADLIPLLPAALSDPAGTAAKLPALFRAYTSNLDAILSQLRAAAGPNTEIVVITQYNPLGGIPSPPLPPGLPDIAGGAIKSLNNLMKSVAAKYEVRVADVAAAFDAAPGGSAVLTFVPTSLASGDPSKIDIYPTVDGYKLYGETVLKATGVTAPLSVKLHVAKKSLARGKTESVTGLTVPGASVKVTVTLPHAKAHAVPISGVMQWADNTGTFTVSFPVKRHSGAAKVKVCASDPVSGHSGCASVSFKVK